MNLGIARLNNYLIIVGVIDRCRFRHDPPGSVFYQLTEPTPLQKKAFQLLGLFPVR